MVPRAWRYVVVSVHPAHGPGDTHTPTADRLNRPLLLSRRLSNMAAADGDSRDDFRHVIPERPTSPEDWARFPLEPQPELHTFSVCVPQVRVHVIVLTLNVKAVALGNHLHYLTECGFGSNPLYDPAQIPG